MTYTPLDNDEDALDFDVEKIEQMEVELEECPHCKGIGSIYPKIGENTPTSRNVKGVAQ
jgi:phage FluMu protein Com